MLDFKAFIEFFRSAIQQSVCNLGIGVPVNFLLIIIGTPIRITVMHL